MNSFDFFIDDRCKDSPFAYQAEMMPDLAPFLDRNEASAAGDMWLEEFLGTLPSIGNSCWLTTSVKVPRLR